MALEEETAVPQATRVLVYVGTYTSGDSQGIYVGELDPASGRLALRDGAVSADQPSFLAVNSQRLCLYAVGEVSDFNGQQSGAVRAFALDPQTGQPTPLNSRSSGGSGPCHLSVDPADRFVLAANYGGGSVALLPLNDDGSLAEAAAEVVSHEGASGHPTRQAGPHAHFITMDPAGRYALAVDLGLDAILTYEINDARGRLALQESSRTPTRAGSGPRHLAFHPTGRYAAVINELDSTLTVWQYEAAQGRLSELQTLSTLPAGFSGPSFAADVHMHPSGAFLYGSNRGHDSIAVFTINAVTGAIALQDIVCTGGRTPRGFAIDPTGAYLIVAHQDTNTVDTFAINPQTGGLTPTGHSASVPNPVCVKALRLPG